jgi:carbonic anhydrase
LLDIDQDPETILQQAVRANIHSSVSQLQQESRVLEQLVREGDLLILGAEYSLDTGIVNFL